MGIATLSARHSVRQKDQLAPVSVTVTEMDLKVNSHQAKRRRLENGLTWAKFSSSVTSSTELREAFLFRLVWIDSYSFHADRVSFYIS